MRKLVIALLVSAALRPSPAEAQVPPEDFVGVPRQYATDQVLAVLGKRHVPQPAGETVFQGEVSANLGTNISCGQLRFNFDLDGMISNAKRIPSMLKGQAEALMNGLPMLLLCQSSPSLCAEIKNLNFQVNEELKALTDVCHAMDSYIGKQAKAGKAQAWEACVQDKMRRGTNHTTAQKECNETPPERLLYTDIAQSWLHDATTDRPQRILQGLLDATGQRISRPLGEEKYAFLSSVLGELKLELNGKLFPVFPAQPTTVKHLAQSVGAAGVTMACSFGVLEEKADDPDPNPYPSGVTAAGKVWYAHLSQIVFQKVDSSDVRNLEALEPGDQQLACNALGRALARATLERLADEGEAMMAQALQTPAIDEELRQAYESRSDRAFTAMRTHRFEGAQHSVEDMLQLIQQMAENERERRRRTGTALSKGQLRMNEEMRETPCTSPLTCER